MELMPTFEKNKIVVIEACCLEIWMKTPENWLNWLKVIVSKEMDYGSAEMQRGPCHGLQHQLVLNRGPVLFQ